MGKLQVVVGGQYGSEGKGAICAYLARAESTAVVGVRVGGSQAGHSAVGYDGKTWRLRHVPVAVACLQSARGVIAAGSEIDLDVLGEEIASLGCASRMTIDAEATIITPDHKLREHDAELTAKIGSTGKGVGAARASRIMRQAIRAGDWAGHPTFKGTLVRSDTTTMLYTALDKGATVQIEGVQGYGLGLHAGFYPTCTSSDCRVIDMLSMAGLSPWTPAAVTDFEPWVVYRTYPIRVAGPSGPMKHEISWEELARVSGGYIQPERTTVTQKIRRVGGWDDELAVAAWHANGQPRVALSFFDYVFPELAGATHPGDLTDQHRRWLRDLTMRTDLRPELLGTGPDSVIDLRGAA